MLGCLKEGTGEGGENEEEGFDFVWARLGGVAEASGCEYIIFFRSMPEKHHH